MNLKEIAPLIPWIVVLILGLVYAKPMMGILNRLVRAKLSKDGVELEAQKQLGKIADQSEEVTQILKDISKQIEKIAQQEKPYADYGDALRDAERCIISCLNDGMKRQKNTTDKNKIEIKVIAVAMTFSWRFICDKVPKILRDYPDSYANIELTFVDHQYLEDLNLENYDINWSEESKQRIRDINNFINGLPEQLSDRLCIVARVYKNLPHWHGFLIDDEYLFLGRTDWSFFRDKPKLTVGQNKYRYFDRSSSTGIERIELFKDWHKYYLQFGSEPLPSTQASKVR
ncbi:hypothetical protein [Dendronalium sp. ChiSLP03b]|uniref:hypothetical protein n=1 Tax=Dendronalium sp. ChiSLP03b TaxID=3075381 RepID=UPI00391BFFBB